ncbi:MAG: CARDB domain-containing protein, partial [Gammaproteobacteria bacterium]
GEDFNYGQDTPRQEVGKGREAVDIQESINTSNLIQPDATYHYRAVAENDNGRSHSGNMSCTTPPDPANTDTDGDGLIDSFEIDIQTDPTKRDTDNDGLSDGEEVNVHRSKPLKADSDGDGLLDGVEVNIHGTNPNTADSDGDGLTDNEELKLYATNPNQADSDGDSLIDSVEVDTNVATDPHKVDTDGDGLQDGDEVIFHHTDPNKVDTDGDGLSDSEEINIHKTDPTSIDSDGDGLNDADEINTHTTHPMKADSDDDGLSDFEEINIHTTDPLNSDSDNDHLIDSAEVDPNMKTDPKNPDSDGDGLTDGAEVNIHLTKPLEIDSDQDGLTDGAEVNQHGTDPNNKDTDGDGINDHYEVNHSAQGHDPLVFDSTTYFPDLVVESVTVPPGAMADRTITLLTTINNQWLGAAGIFSVSYYLTQPDQATQPDLWIGDYQVSSLEAVSNLTFSHDLLVPVQVKGGVYRIKAIIDSGYAVVEDNEFNNEGLSSGMSISERRSDGSDGAVNVVGTLNMNTDSLGSTTDNNGAHPDGFATSITANASVGDTLITVDSTAGFVEDDEVLIIQMTHASNHGVYEFNSHVTVVDGTTLRLGSGLLNDYFHDTVSKTQVLRIPQYTDVFIPTISMVTVSQYDEITGTGGLIAFRASGMLTVDGSINADGKGFLGGQVPGWFGEPGHSYTGVVPTSNLYLANAGGGGGGTEGNMKPGAGGGHRLLGVSSTTYNTFNGGGTYGDAEFIKMHLGSGGGASNTKYSHNPTRRFGGLKGGSGGGIVWLSATYIDGFGSISANGGDARKFEGSKSGAGAGGAIYLESNTQTSVSVEAQGGAGYRICTTQPCVDSAGGAGWVKHKKMAQDITVTIIDVPLVISQGGSFKVTSTITNLIGNPIAVPIHTEYYLSNSPNDSTNDILVGNRLQAGIKDFTSDTRITNILSLPMSVLPGQYYLRGIVDTQQLVPEINESNNSVIYTDNSQFPIVITIQ